MSDDELTAIKNDLRAWQKYCSVWAVAYRRGAQSALVWNSWMVSIGILLAAITTVLSAIGGAATAARGFAIAGAVVAAATTAINGFQKLSWASAEQIKQCHSAAGAYESIKRDIDSALTSVDSDDLKKQRDTIKQELSATDAQAPELRGKFSTQPREELRSPVHEEAADPTRPATLGATPEPRDVPPAPPPETPVGAPPEPPRGY